MPLGKRNRVLRIHPGLHWNTVFARHPHTIKGTLVPSEIGGQVPARRRFGNMYTRLKIRVKDLQT